MNNNNTNDSNISRSQLDIPWYQSPIFIAVIMVIAGLTLQFYIGIFIAVLGIILLVKQRKVIKRLSKKANSIFDVEEYKLEVENTIKKEKVQADEEIISARNDAKNHLTEVEAEVHDKELKIDSLNKKIKDLKNEISRLTKDIYIEYISPYQFDTNITSEEYKNKLSILKIEEKEFLKSDKCIVYGSGYKDVSKKSLNNDVKQLLRCFNSESTSIISGVTVKNVDTCRTKLQRAYDALNKLFLTDCISLNPKCLEFKFDELTIMYNYQLKIEQEKEQQKAIKEQMIEEEKVRREIEREKAKLDKEESQFKNEISKLMKYLQKASDIEKQLYIDKIKELEDKLKDLEKDRENVLEREQNTRAGFVYIISNIGSFGENIYKIGMTRRLEPMDRVKELGSASVPFEFDVHAMIFSDDAPALENILHKTFEKNAVNKVNPRKEFYRVDLHEVEKVVKKNHNATVTFTELAKADQYRQTLQIEKNMK